MKFNINKGVLALLIFFIITITFVSAYDYESVDYKNTLIHIDSCYDVPDKIDDVVRWVWQSGRVNQTPVIDSFNPSSIIHMSSINTSLINATWRFNFSDDNFTGTDNNNDAVFDYTVYYLKNVNPNGRLFVASMGHGEGSESGVLNFTNALLAEGYDVLIEYMAGSLPYDGHSDHDWMSAIYNAGVYNPVEAFFNDIYWSLNYVLNETTYTDVSMGGISGGGWATVWYSAIDTRIKNSYPVAGSYPRIIYDETMVGQGDWEQGSPSTVVHDFLADNTSYFDLYIMSSWGRRHLATYNENEGAFGGTHFSFYESYIHNKSLDCSGLFDVNSTDSSTHQITSGALEWIIDDVNTVDLAEPKIYIKAEINAADNTFDELAVYKPGYNKRVAQNNINFDNIVFE